MRLRARPAFPRLVLGAGNLAYQMDCWPFPTAYDFPCRGWRTKNRVLYQNGNLSLSDIYTPAEWFQHHVDSQMSDTNFAVQWFCHHKVFQPVTRRRDK